MNSFDPSAAASNDSGIFGLPHDEEEAKVILIPVPFDATTSYKRGTEKGPDCIRNASRQVDLFDIETGKPYEAGIFMAPIDEKVVHWNQLAKQSSDPIIEKGGHIEDDPMLMKQASIVNGITSKLNDWVYHSTKAALMKEKIVGIIGGDHSVPLGAIQAYAEKYKNFGILHIDAHADLRDAYEGFSHSHASIMNNVIRQIPEVTRLVQVGIRDFCEEEYEIIQKSQGRILLQSMPALRKAMYDGASWTSLCSEIIKPLPSHVYISFDIDGLDPSLCPNTGTPVPGGLLFQEVTHLFSTLVSSGRKIVGFDLNEVAPSSDPNNEWDGNVAARLLYKMIGFTLLSQQAKQG